MNPLIHSVDQCILLLLICQRNSVKLQNLANSYRIEIQCCISSLRFQDTIIVSTNNSREFQFVCLTTSLNRYCCGYVLSIAAPTILHSELYATCLLICLQIEIYNIITLCQWILTTREAEELTPIATRYKVDCTINNGRFATHCIEWERTVGICLHINLLLNLNSRVFKFVELNLSHIESYVSSLRLQNTIVVSANNSGIIKFINLLSGLHRNTNSHVLGISAPTILNCQLNTISILIGSHVKTYQVITLCQCILTTREDKELVPVTIWYIMKSTIYNRRFTAHWIMWERTIRCILITLGVDQFLQFGIRINIKFLIL